MKSLKKKFENIVNDYITEFVAKHEYEFDGWVGDNVGEMASFIDQYFFSLDDIRHDIDNDIPSPTIFRWQDYVVEWTTSLPELHSINFKSYCMGARYSDEEINRLLSDKAQELEDRVNDHEELIDKLIEKIDEMRKNADILSIPRDDEDAFLPLDGIVGAE
jgi:hypothetical protein